MNLLLFIIMVVVSFTVVRIGAIAFELTGLEPSLARFQALSCFSGTGFTTREAELITGNPQRRNIASVLMVLGNAGLVTLIATFANSIRPDLYFPKFTIPFLDLVFPARIIPWVNLVIIALSVIFIYRFFTHARFMDKFTALLKERLVKKEIIKPVSFEELTVATGGYGVSSIDVCPESSIAGKSLRESDLRVHDITVLVIEHDSVTTPNPPPDTRVYAGDRLVCFGRLSTIREELCVS